MAQQIVICVHFVSARSVDSCLCLLLYLTILIIYILRAICNFMLIAKLTVEINVGLRKTTMVHVYT